MWEIAGELPHSIKIDGIDYPINWDFRTSLAFNKLVEEKSDDPEMWIDALELYYGGIPAKFEDAIEAMIAFYECGGVKKAGDDSQENTRIIDFEIDMPYIYAAFLSQYAVDLYAVTNLHWWRFMYMFKGLKQDARIVEIMGHRSAKEESWMTKEQKAEIRRMHRIWDLDALTAEEQQQEKEMMKILAAGGDEAVKLLMELNSREGDDTLEEK